LKVLHQSKEKTVEVVLGAQWIGNW
jgi:hypothetical protein